MSKYNPKNERIKHEYFSYLKEAMRYSETGSVMVLQIVVLAS